MADELAARLARRQKIAEGEEPGPAENIGPKYSEPQGDEKDTLDAADNELASKLKRLVDNALNVKLRFEGFCVYRCKRCSKRYHHLHSGENTDRSNH